MSHLPTSPSRRRSASRRSVPLSRNSSTRSDRASSAMGQGSHLDGETRSGRLFVLDLGGGRVLSMEADGSHREVIAADCPHPDGVVVDAQAGHVYWTNMGVPSLNDGSIERADID